MLLESEHVAEQDLLATPAAFDGYDFVTPDKVIQAHATATGSCTQASKVTELWGTFLAQTWLFLN